MSGIGTDNAAAAGEDPDHDHMVIRSFLNLTALFSFYYVHIPARKLAAALELKSFMDSPGKLALAFKVLD